MTPDLADLNEHHVGVSWRELAPGWAFRTSARTITETDLATFVTAAGFVEPLFLDVRHRQVDGSLGRLVPAVLTLGLAEGLVVQSRVFHGTALALFSIALDIRAPLRTGDTIAVAVEVAEVSPTSDGKRAKVTTINTVIDQDDRIVMEYRPVRLMV